MTPVRRIFADYREAGSLEALIHLDSLVDRRTFLARGGDLFTVLRATPRDAECLDPGQLDHLTRQFEGALPEKAPSFYFIDIQSADSERFDAFVRKNAPQADLEASFALAARQPICKGFAIGRTIFGAPAKAWMTGEIDDPTPFVPTHPPIEVEILTDATEHRP